MDTFRYLSGSHGTQTEQIRNSVGTLLIVHPLFVRFGIPTDVDTLAGVERLVNGRASESQRLDFKRQLHGVDQLADDLSALANVGGGVLIIGVGTDRTDRADSLHEQDLRTVEQQVVQAGVEMGLTNRSA